MRGFAEHLIGFPQLSQESFEFNKFNNIRARMQDSIDHMILKSNFLANFALKRHDFAIGKRDVFMEVTTLFACLCTSGLSF